MSNFILLTEKPWHDQMFEELLQREGENWTRIKSKPEFNLERLMEISPEKIFIPHWSYIIPESIWSTFDCIVFHMTDLPYGRGGSPLQNLIVRGHSTTKISALKVNNGIDTGDIYCKSELSLTGSAREIFDRSTPIISSMISRIIDEALNPMPQTGEPTAFKRRGPKDGKMNDLVEITECYDYIRMLDADGYPRAFIETDSFRIEFENADLSEDKSDLKAHVRIIKK